MFDVVSINDKYSILYLEDEVKNNFITLLLIGLDNKYMDVDLNTLKNSSEHYKEKLNKRCQKKFKKNFNLNTKSHLRFLADICQVNLTIRDLAKNLNKYSMNGYKKTIYLVNKGNEYGLVLKNNKKSMNTALPKSDLPALEQLSLEGGDGEEVFVMEGGPATQPSQQPNNNGSENGVSNTVSEMSNNESISAVSDSSENKVYSQEQQQSAQETYKNCINDCIVNNIVNYNIMYLDNKIKEKINENINDWEDFLDINKLGSSSEAAKNPKIIIDSMVEGMEYFVKRQEYKEEWDRAINKKRDKPNSSTQYPSSEKMIYELAYKNVIKSINERNERRREENLKIEDPVYNVATTNDMRRELQKIELNEQRTKENKELPFGTLNKKEKELLESLIERYNKYETSLYIEEGSDDLISWNNAINEQKKNINRRINDKLRERINIVKFADTEAEVLALEVEKLNQEVLFGMKMNLLDRNYNLAEDEYIEEDDIEEDDIEEDEDNQIALQKESLKRKTNNSRKTYEFTRTRNRYPKSKKPRNKPQEELKQQQKGSGITSQYGGVKPWTSYLDIPGNKTGTKSKNSLLLNQLNNLSLIKLLEMGIDSMHDFASLLKSDDIIEVAPKDEVFDVFLPYNFDEAWEFPDADYKRFIKSLSYKFFIAFNKKIMEGIINRGDEYTLDTPGLKIPFHPRITKEVMNMNDSTAHFKKGWERNATLYYTYGNTKPAPATYLTGVPPFPPPLPAQPPPTPIGYTGVNLKKLAIQTNKNIIIFQDSEGASQSAFSLFTTGNTFMKPGSFFSSVDNYLNDTKNKKTNRAKFIKEINKIKQGKKSQLPYLDNAVKLRQLKNILYNPLKKIHLNNPSTLGQISLVASENEFLFQSPANLIDGAGIGSMNIKDFIGILNQINIKIGTGSAADLSLSSQLELVDFNKYIDTHPVVPASDKIFTKKGTPSIVDKFETDNALHDVQLAAEAALAEANALAEPANSFKKAVVDLENDYFKKDATRSKLVNALKAVTKTKAAVTTEVTSGLAAATATAKATATAAAGVAAVTAGEKLKELINLIKLPKSHAKYNEANEAKKKAIEVAAQTIKIGTEAQEFPYKWDVDWYYNEDDDVKRLIYNGDQATGSANYYKVNILEKTYSDHFDRICENSSKPNSPINQLTGYRNHFNINYLNTIKFEVVLGVDKPMDNKGNIINAQDDRLWPVLMMSFIEIDPITRSQVIDGTPKIHVAQVQWANLGDKNKIAAIIDILYNNLPPDDGDDDDDKVNLYFKGIKDKIKSISDGLDIVSYLYILDLLVHFRLKTRTNKAGATGGYDYYTLQDIWAIFVRILYTFKMMGDQGQVKFIKALKDNVTNFNDNFEVLLTTHDSLCRLYACEHKVSNMTKTEPNFPSDEYCKSTPRGMVYYPS